MATSEEIQKAQKLFDEGNEFYDEGKKNEALNNKEVAAKNFEAAVKKYEDATQIDKDNVEILKKYGNALYSQEKYNEAIEKYEKVLQIDPKYVIAYYKLANALFTQKKYEAAADNYKKFTDNNKKHEKAWNNWGLALYYQGKLDEAIDKYKTATDIHPKYVKAWNNWGLALYSKKKYDEAIEKYKTAIGLDSSRPSPLHNMAELKYRNGLYFESKLNWKNAIQTYKDFLTIESNRYNTNYQYLGLIHQKIFQEYQEAEEAFKKGFYLEPENPELLLDIIQLYKDIQRNPNHKDNDCKDSAEILKERNRSHFKEVEYFNTAFKVFEKKFQDEKNKEHLAWRARLLRLGGKIHQDNAIKYYKLWIEAEKDSVEAKVGLATLFLGKGKKYFGKALELLEQAIELDFDDLGNLSLLAKAYMLCGDYSKSEYYYRKVFNVTDGHMDAIIGSGELYLSWAERAKKDGENDAAAEKFEMSKKYFEQARCLSESDFQTNNASRLLFPDELSFMFYNLGYVLSELANYDKKNSAKFLKDAMKSFGLVQPDTMDYFAAQNAKKKIINWLKKYSVSYEVNIKRIQYALWGILICIQAFFFIGRPAIQPGEYSLNKEKVQLFFNSVHINAANEVNKKVNYTDFLKLADQVWPDKEKAKASILEILKSLNVSENSIETLFKPQLNNFVSIKNKEAHFRLVPLEPYIYITMTFGLLLFLIASPYLNEINRLKIGSFELEKSSGHLILSSSLNIGMGSSMAVLSSGLPSVE